MATKVIYKDEVILPGALSALQDGAIALLRERGVTEGDVLLCKAETHLGTLLQWLCCQRCGWIPVLLPVDSGVLAHQDRIPIKGRWTVDGRLQSEFTAIEPSGRAGARRGRIPIGSAIQLTSASSGEPKWVLRTPEVLVGEASRHAAHLRATAEDVILPITPLYHSFGFSCGMLVALYSGATVVIPDVVMPRNVVSLCNRHKASIVLGVPYFFQKMTELEERHSFDHPLRHIIASGGPMPEGLQARFAARFGQPLIQMYGSTETGGLSMSEPGDDYNVVGRPYAGVKFEIVVNHEQKPCIQVSSPETMATYIHPDGFEELPRHAYRPGDVGRILESGKLMVEGRSDDVVIIAGKKVPVRKVTEVLESSSPIQVARIYAVSSGALAELACDYYCEREIEAGEVIAACGAVLPKYQVPLHFKRVPQAPRRRAATWKEGK